MDDCAGPLQMLSQVVRHCWERATVVACTDSHSAWTELQQRPPDIFITDLIHAGIDGFEMLRRMAEARVTFPIVVLSARLPDCEAEARQAAGSNLRVSFWPKPVSVANLAEHLRRCWS